MKHSYLASETNESIYSRHQTIISLKPVYLGRWQCRVHNSGAKLIAATVLIHVAYWKWTYK